MEIDLERYRQPIYSERTARELDKFAISEFGISATSLMGFAALSIFQKFSKLFRNARIIILSGKGNNGGDGLSLAYFLFQSGCNVKVYLKEGEYSKATEFYNNLLIKSSLNICTLGEFNSEKFQNSENQVFVDCLLGTGFKPPISTEYSEIIQKVNSIKENYPNTKIISIDTISGFSPSSPGTDPYFLSDILCEVGTKKIHSFFYPDKLKKTYHNIGFPLRNYKSPDEPVFELKEIPWKKIQNLIGRKKNSNKYSNGSISIIGGSNGMSGAAIMSQRAFHMTGGGISKVFSNSELTISEILAKDESMMAGNLKNFKEDQFFQKSKVVLIGPGLDKKDFPYEMNSIIQKEKLYVLDAGALDMVSQKKLSPNVILTPHTGEFSRLTGKKYKTKFEAYEDLKEYSKAFHVNVLLKDSISVFSNFSGERFIWNYPNPKLAVMGSGDLLAGILSGLLSREYEILNSVQLSLSILQYSLNMKTRFPTASKIRKFIEKSISNG